MITTLRRSWLFLSLVLSVPTLATNAGVIALQNQGLLRAAIEVESEPPYYQRAPLVLAIDIATSLRFAGGTRVVDLRIPGALVRPVSSFALNSSKRIDGREWISQRWRFRIYPQEPGNLEIPAITVAVSLDDDVGKTVSGELRLTRPALEISAPPGTETLKDWIATPRLEVDETWDDRLDTYEPGDAITRHRRFVADDMPGMLLTPSAISDIPGLSLYVAPAQVSDQESRGSLRGLRRETLVATLEMPGTYRLPGRTLHWYNTRTGSIETLELPAYEFTVVEGALVQDDPKGQRADGRSAWSDAAYGLLGALILFLALTLGRTRVRRLAQALGRHLEPTHQYRAYRRALRQGNPRQALELLNQSLRRHAPERSLREVCAGDATAARALRDLLAAAYEPPDEASDGASASHAAHAGLAGSSPDLHHLWQRTRSAQRTLEGRPDSELRLNPRSAPSPGPQSF